VVDLELARRLARRKGIPKYQTYIKTLLHEMLVKEAENERKLP
jgi:predicted DNA binding CopG/RHH family protein